MATSQAESSTLPIEVQNESEENANNVETEGVVDAAASKRKRTSVVWNDFEIIEVEGKPLIAKCKHCKKSLGGASTNGTSSLRRHLEHCAAKKINSKGQSLLNMVKSASDGKKKLESYKFSQIKSRKDLALAIIKHKYPFNIVEHEFLEAFCNGLNPEFKMVSRNTIRNDVLEIQKVEKEKVYTELGELSCRITLTTDIWTSDHQNIAYASLTAHYIDDQWNLHHKIVAYRKIPCPHDGDTLYEFISQLILEWNIDKKLSCMVVDNAGTNDLMVKKLKKWLCDKSLLPIDGELFHVRCSAHILNLIVQDGLKCIVDLITKIRETVKYLSRSTYGKEKFDVAVKQVRLQAKKKVPMDVPTRWNSTYLMLVAALDLKEAFNRFAEIDKRYKHNPSQEEWKVAGLVSEFLKLFYDATLLFSGTNYPTSNIFFAEICEIHYRLIQLETSEHECIRVMVPPMKLKFAKYWENCSLALAIGVILDPRFKMNIIIFYYRKLYPKDLEYEPYIKRVREAFSKLYHEYACDSLSDLQEDTNVSHDISASQNDKLSEYDMWMMESTSDNVYVNQKSELDTYLEEPVFPRKDGFCVLQWWKLNSAKFPCLGRMARDILAIPATTVASESAFSIGERVLDENRSSLLPEVVEALITADDWIKSYKLKNVDQQSIIDV